MTDKALSPWVRRPKKAGAKKKPPVMHPRKQRARALAASRPKSVQRKPKNLK